MTDAKHSPLCIQPCRLEAAANGKGPAVQFAATVKEVVMKVGIDHVLALRERIADPGIVSEVRDTTGQIMAYANARANSRNLR